MCVCFILRERYDDDMEGTALFIFIVFFMLVFSLVVV